MKITQLAQQLETTIETIYDYLEESGESFERTPDFDLSEEIVEKAIAFKAAWDKKRKQQKQQKFDLSDNALLKEIMDYNEVSHLILTGEFSIKEKVNYGYFIDIEHLSGKKIYSPSGEMISHIFMPKHDSINAGIRYSFRPFISKKSEREKFDDPYLLMTTHQQVDIQGELDHYQKAITQLKQNSNFLTKNLEQYERQVSRVKGDLGRWKKKYDRKRSEAQKALDEELAQSIQNKQKEADEIVNEYNQAIESRYAEFQEATQQVQSYKKQITQLTEEYTTWKEKTKAMKTTLDFLKTKIDFCGRMEFLSKEDANKYLTELERDQAFSPGDNYLHFTGDFSKDYSKLAGHIQQYLYHEKKLIYTDFQIRNFLTLLMTNDLIVLSGLSGSGKTQIVKSFAEAVGGVAKIIPVKPNWMSSEDLLGYYNPIQSSFLPTPFTEAIVEAAQNPNQLYLICLDEMNLSRVEYYFADFLSALEEREQQPTISLYAEHEEELFVSEFKTLLSLLESSLGDQQVESWTSFLENDTIRKRFYKLLGKVDQDSILKIHAKMKRRLLDVLKFPSKITIPTNVRFIGAINVDETTHYFSPKVLDRVHIVKFENPLLLEDTVHTLSQKDEESSLKPVYVHPSFFGERAAYPSLSAAKDQYLAGGLRKINREFLLKLSIDFGIRSMRQALNYNNLFWEALGEDKDPEFNPVVYNIKLAEEEKTTIAFTEDLIVFNAIINQKVLPRILLDSSEVLPGEKTKLDILNELQAYLKQLLMPTVTNNENQVFHYGDMCYDLLANMIRFAEQNNGQVNFWTVTRSN